MSEQRQQGEPEAAGITRRDLELVIRRAAELYALDADAEDRLSEREVMRVAEELGLPARHVRQALYELPADRPASGFLDRWYGATQVQGTRVVPGAPDAVLTRLEDYLVTREFLQVLRRQGGKAAFVPADDAISSMVRAVRRPQRHWQIARSRRVLVEVRPIPDAESHVRLELDMTHHRKGTLTGGVVGGSLIGLPLAVGALLPAGSLDPAAAIALTMAGVGALGASVTAGVAIARSRFRNRLDKARLEIASLLDRLEAGGRLDPPPAPWVRGLRTRIAGALRPTR